MPENLNKHKKINILFPLSFLFGPHKIIGGNPANLDNGIRALPRLVRAEEGQEEGAAG